MKGFSDAGMYQSCAVLTTSLLLDSAPVEFPLREHYVNQQISLQGNPIRISLQQAS